MQKSCDSTAYVLELHLFCINSLAPGRFSQF